MPRGAPGKTRRPATRPMSAASGDAINTASCREGSSLALSDDQADDHPAINGPTTFDPPAMRGVQSQTWFLPKSGTYGFARLDSYCDELRLGNAGRRTANGYPGQIARPDHSAGEEAGSPQDRRGSDEASGSSIACQSLRL